MYAIVNGEEQAGAVVLDADVQFVEYADENVRKVRLPGIRSNLGLHTVQVGEPSDPVEEITEISVSDDLRVQ